MVHRREGPANKHDRSSILADEETIIAQCSPQGKGAIALLKLSGSNVRTIVASIAELPFGKFIAKIPTGTVSYGWIVDDEKQRVDQVMFIIMDGPKTFTGQNTIEITCHNNQFLIEKIISQAIKHGARLAQQGEFARRAVLNGKIDLIQAEAINDLIHANTQLALKKSLAQVEGSFSAWLHLIEKDLIKALAWSEASFEFLDEEEEFGSQIKEHIQNLNRKISDLKKTFDSQQQIRQGIRIALIGSVNAGKSSLFNSLLDQNRSIVTEIPGTTRDSVESGLYKNGNYWTLIDTAGIRQTNDIIEKEGIKRSLEQALLADILLLVFDGSRTLSTEEETFYHRLLTDHASKVILVKNKDDLTSLHNTLLENNYFIPFSSITKNNLERIEAEIEQKIVQLFSAIESPFLLNKRQFTTILTLENKLIAIIEMLSHKFINYEIISLNLRDAIEQMSELTGKSVNEAGLDMVFKEFCVGK